MVGSALAVIFISTPEFAAATEADLTQVYTAFKTDDDNSNATKLGLSIINGLIIVSVVCLMTFVIVLFYKFHCYKCLSGYMIMSSTMILGLLASNLSFVAIERYQIPIDKISFYIIMYNFAMTGVLCIIAPGGAVPYYLNQCYLAATSIIVAWHFSRFDPWTAWVLLILLALYDLFAVLSPYGPLRALVNLMQRENSPMIPGLLYEANLSTQPQPLQQQQQQQPQQRNHQNHLPQPTNRASQETRNGGRANDDAGSAEEDSPGAEDAPLLSNDHSSHHEESIEKDRGDDDVAQPQQQLQQQQPTGDTRGSHVTDSTRAESRSVDTTGDVPGRIPLALAQRYKLRFPHDPQPYWITDPEHPVPYTPAQLHGVVDVLFPRRGGRIVPTISLDTASGAFYRRHRTTGRHGGGADETRYTIIDHTGVHRRVIFVTHEGRVFEDLREQQYREDEEEDAKERTSIKLGLGDFIFYSILVSKAALYSFTAFGACLVAIISGLGLTLLLLAMRRQALPALPISIFMGVFFYLTTRFGVEPWIRTVFEAPVFF
jgi:presenilin-like A22 family membrane protease